MFSMANIFSSGVTASLLGGKHVKRTRYAYHLTLALLHVLKLRAYKEYCTGYGPHEPTDVWEQRLIDASPTISYWTTVREYLLINCHFVKGQRQGDWPLTLSACEDLCSWFFVFGHTNYAQWLPVFLQNMARLPDLHPSVHAEFMEGNFVVQRSEKKFSMMGLDQSQEHSIQFLKEDSGPNGLYGQEEEKEMIELSKPEVLRIVHEFQNACFKETTKRSTEHPEASSAEQSKFLKHLKALVSLVDEDRVVNSFTEQGPELVTLDTGEVMDPAIADGLKEAKSIGKNMQVEFVRERLETGKKPLSDVIPRTNVYTFVNRPPADLKRGTDKLGSARANAALTTKMFMSLLARPESDMAEFFKHENRREPPSLTQDGKLRTGTKSVVVTCLPSMPDPGRSIEAKEATVRVFDMAAIVHMIKPQCAHLFGEYSAMQLMPFLEGQMTINTLRIDLIWDTYSETSLKSQTREKRSQQAGRRTRVAAQIPIPKGAQWATFLEDAENKDELFRFVSEDLHNLAANKDYHLITTKDDCVLNNMEIDTSTLCPCSHEEADTRMMLHLRHAADEGHTKAFLRTVDSDVVVLAVSLFGDLGLSELWIGYGTGKKDRDIPVHQVAAGMGPCTCKALPLFHAFTGCDVTSSMFGIGKKTAYNAWMAFPEVTDTLVALTNNPSLLTTDPIHMRRLERWTVLMYSKNCVMFSINDARQFMFSIHLKSMDAIPPTHHALIQHAKRALLVASFIWSKSLTKEPEMPEPADWGSEWNPRTKRWMPHWTDLPDVSEACSLLVRCGCAVACKGNCKCHRAGLHCSQLCKCQGGCTNND
ncbi:hypothetical protein ACOMHN_015291 [Nucella lapillus]